MNTSATLENITNEDGSCGIFSWSSALSAAFTYGVSWFFSYSCQLWANFMNGRSWVTIIPKFLEAIQDSVCHEATNFISAVYHAVQRRFIWLQDRSWLTPGWSGSDFFVERHPSTGLYYHLHCNFIGLLSQAIISRHRTALWSRSTTTTALPRHEMSGN